MALDAMYRALKTTLETNFLLFKLDLKHFFRIYFKFQKMSKNEITPIIVTDMHIAFY